MKMTIITIITLTITIITITITIIITIIIIISFPIEELLQTITKESIKDGEIENCVLQDGKSDFV